MALPPPSPGPTRRARLAETHSAQKANSVCGYPPGHTQLPRLAGGKASGVPQSRPGSARLALSFPWASGTAMFRGLMLAESWPPGGRVQERSPGWSRGTGQGAGDADAPGTARPGTPSVPTVASALSVCQRRGRLGLLQGCAGPGNTRGGEPTAGHTTPQSTLRPGSQGDSVH